MPSVQLLAPLSLVVSVVLIGNQIGLHYNRDIDRVEIAIDHSTVPDETAEPEIPLDQWWQLRKCSSVID
jgi:hypothetical protein